MFSTGKNWWLHTCIVHDFRQNYISCSSLSLSVLQYISCDCVSCQTALKKKEETELLPRRGRMNANTFFYSKISCCDCCHDCIHEWTHETEREHETVTVAARGREDVYITCEMLMSRAECDTGVETGLLSRDHVPIFRYSPTQRILCMWLYNERDGEGSTSMDFPSSQDTQKVLTYVQWTLQWTDLCWPVNIAVE